VQFFYVRFNHNGHKGVHYGRGEVFPMAGFDL